MPKDNSGYRELEGRTQEGERRNHITPILLKATIFLLNVQFAQVKNILSLASGASRLTRENKHVNTQL